MDPGCVSVKCAAHSFQLLLHDLEDLPPVRGALAAMDSVLQQCESREIQDKLLAVQVAAGKERGFCPPKPGETRWSSKVYAMERIISLKPYLNTVLTSPPTEAQWVMLRNAVDRLRPVADATEDVQMDSSDLMTVIRHVDRIKIQAFLYQLFFIPILKFSLNLKTIKNRPAHAHWSHQADFTVFHTSALRALDHRCKKHFSSFVTVLCRALQPDANLANWNREERLKVSNAMNSYGMAIIKKHGHTDEQAGALRAQLGQWVQRDGTLANPVGPVPQALHYWQEIALHVPLLSLVAKALFSIHPTEACVERSFSAMGLLHTDLRNSLSEESVKALLNVKFNTARLYNIPCMQRKKRVREEEEEVVDVDA